VCNATETVFLDNNNLLNTEEEMDAFCSNIDDETNTANFMFFSVDEPVVCSTECCSLICRSGDLDCNKLATLNKYDDEDLDSRSEYVFSEDINVRSNERRRR
jgi:hypothetical protein